MEQLIINKLYEILQIRINKAITEIISHRSIQYIDFKKKNPLEQEKMVMLYLYKIFGTHPPDIVMNCPDFLISNSESELFIRNIIETIYIQVLLEIMQIYKFQGDYEYVSNECYKVLFIFSEFVNGEAAILEMQSLAVHAEISITSAAAAAA